MATHPHSLDVADAWQAEAETWSFAMVTPDAVVGGYLDFVLERLAANGFEVRATRLLKLDYERLGRMYSHRDDPPVPTGDRIELPGSVMKPLYQLAPAVVLVVRRAAGDACAALLRTKGATRPDAAAPGTVREAGEHAIFNFMHCPDDAPSAAIELGYLVGVDEAAALCAAALAGESDPRAGLLGLDALRPGLPAFSGWEVLSFPLLANRLRWRLVQALATRAGDQDLETLHGARDGLVRERASLLAAPDVAARMRLAQAAHPALHGALRTAAVAAGEDVIGTGLDALAELYDLEGARELPPLLALEGRGIYLSELEKVALDAHRHAFWVEAQPPRIIVPRA